MTILEQDVRRAAATVLDPNTQQDFVSTGQLKNLQISGGDVSFDIELGYPARSQMPALRQALVAAVRTLGGVGNVSVNIITRVVAHAVQRGVPLLPGVKNIVAVASGKGGVGKSTTAVNLALALAAEGASVGILDADIYGPSMPIMMGLSGRPESLDGKTMEPLTNHGVQVISIGFLVDPDQATIWRGPMATQALDQLLRQTHWKELDYLIVDLPPGTGDIQLSLSQRVPLTGAVIVTTPQDVALRIAKKGLKMFQQVNVPIIGVIENMAGFACPSCGAVHNIFSEGGGERAARDAGVPFLGSVPLDPQMVQGGDAGTPLVVFNPKSAGAKAFEEIAKKFAAQLSVSNIKEQSVTDRPKEVHLIDQTPPKIVWSDGKVSTFDHFQLRMACPCAACRSETTGERILKESDVPRDVKVVAANPVGRYGLNLGFSDGHASGIFTFDHLRALGIAI